MRAVTLLPLIWPGALAWVTISQSRFGAQLEDIRLLMHIPENGTFWRWPSNGVPDQQLLGYLWTMPEDPLSHEGLGGGITYQWDPGLCDVLLPRFREDFFFVPFVTCSMLKAAMTRGFSSWAANSARISFVDVTQECAHIEKVGPDCPLSELWITAIGGTDGGAASQAGLTSGLTTSTSQEEADTLITEFLGGGTSAALAQPVARYSTGFRYTNGARPASGRVIETHKAVVSFNTELCWYLDSTFCAYFHSLKSQFSSLTPTEILWVGRGILAAIWTLAFLIMGVQIFRILNSSTSHSHGLSSKCMAGLDTLHRISMCGFALRLVLLVAPPAFYLQIFLPCWECYDFEAAATHEVGHVLGLSHPDTVTSSLCEASGCGPHPGQNVYSPALTGGGRLSRLSCLNPWMWVEPDTSTEVRDSIMKALTQHNPRVCLTEDDLEALNVLYPDCTHSISTPVCDKVAHNIGWVRLAVWVGVPVLIALAFLVCIFSYASHHQVRRLDLQIQARMQRSLELMQVGDQHREAVEAHAVVSEQLAHQKATEGERIRREARRLSCQYIKDHMATGIQGGAGGPPGVLPPGALPPGAPPAHMPPPAHHQGHSGLWGGLMSMLSRASSRHHEPQRATSTCATDPEATGIQGDGPGAANASALDRARRLTKQASRSVSVGKLNKVESAGLLGSTSAAAADDDEPVAAEGAGAVAALADAIPEASEEASESSRPKVAPAAVTSSSGSSLGV